MALRGSKVYIGCQDEARGLEAFVNIKQKVGGTRFTFESATEYRFRVSENSQKKIS